MKDGQQEIELKLSLSPDDLAALQRCEAVRRHQQGRAATTQLHAIYFDTPDLSLNGRKVALRVRKEGRQWIQCLKAAGDGMGGVMVREELEAVVPGPHVDINMIKDSDFRDVLTDDEAERLVPAFETRIKRTSRKMVLDDGTELSMDVDTGEIVSGERSVDVCEVELELVSGDPTRIYGFARELCAAAPMRINVHSKAQRGFALLTGQGPEWHKASVPTLRHDMTVEEVLAAIIQSCLNHLVLNEDCVLARTHVEGVHQMRVATRRLRSALSLFKAMLPVEQASRLNEELRWVINEMGPARDLDVFVEETLNSVMSRVTDEPALGKLLAHAQTARDAGYERAQAALRSPRYTDLLLSIGEWTATRAWRAQAISESSARLLGPISALSGELLHNHYRRLRKRGRNFETLSTEERHQVRIAVKKMRYAIEFLSSLYSADRVDAFLASLRGLQDGLGLMNDIAVMHHLLDELTAGVEGDEGREVSLAAGIIIGWFTHIMDAKEQDMVASWTTFTKGQPFWPEDARRKK